MVALHSYSSAVKYLFSEVEFTAEEQFNAIAGVVALHLTAYLGTSLLSVLCNRQLRYSLTKVNAGLATIMGLALATAPKLIMQKNMEEATLQWKIALPIINGIALLQLASWAISSRRVLRGHRE